MNMLIHQGTFLDWLLSMPYEDRAELFKEPESENTDKLINDLAEMIADIFYVYEEACIRHLVSEGVDPPEPDSNEPWAVQTSKRVPVKQKPDRHLKLIIDNSKE